MRGETDVFLLPGKGKRMGHLFPAVFEDRPFMVDMAAVDNGEGEFVHMLVLQGTHVRAVDVGQGNGIPVHRTAGFHARLVAQQAVMRHDHLVPVLCVDRDHFLGCSGVHAFDHRRAVRRQGIFDGDSFLPVECLFAALPGPHQFFDQFKRHGKRGGMFGHCRSGPEPPQASSQHEQEDVGAHTS